VADRVGAVAMGGLAASSALLAAVDRDDRSIVYGRLLEIAATHGLSSVV
jgi:hypothetical protein